MAAIFAPIPDDTLLNQLIQAAISSYDPLTSNEQRRAAAEFINSVKCNGSIAHKKIDSSFHLISNPPSDMSALPGHSGDHVRMFAFQLLEHTIKHDWNKLMEAQKDDVLRRLEQLLVTSSATFSSPYLRDGLARCITAAALHAWPTKWQTLLPTCLGSPLNPCTLQFLLRIAEDVGVVFQRPDPHRRREVLNKLKNELPSILSYISTCLQSANQPDLSLIALKTLTSYLDWNPVDEGILKFLITLLSFPMNYSGQSVNFWLEAKSISCECLISIYSKKKPKLDEAEVLTNVLRSPESLSSITYLSQLVRGILLEDKFDGSFFELGKKSCSLLTKLAKFILNHDKYVIFDVKSVSKEESKINESKQFERAILGELLEIYSHPCQSLSYLTFEFWKDFWKEKASLIQGDGQNVKGPIELPDAIYQPLHDLAKSILLQLPKLIVKCNVKHEFVIYAFAESSEYEENFYPRFKNELLEILKYITTAFESLVMQFIIELFTQLKNESITQLHLLSQQQQQLQHQLEQGSPVKLNFANWDILAVILDSVCARICNPSKFIHQVQPCLDFLLDQSSELMSLPLLLSHQLSCISSFAPFLPHLPTSFTERVVNRMLLLASYKLDDATSSNNRNFSEIIPLHGHACNAFVKLARRVPSLLVPLFDSLQSQIYSGTYTKLKVEVLTEGLILISNKFENEANQKAFIIHVIEQITWLANFNMDTLAFVDFLGLTQAPNVLTQILANVPSNTTSDAGNTFQAYTNSTSPEVRMHHENRTIILFNVNLVMALVKRTENKSILLPELMPFFKATLNMINHLNTMWHPQFRSAGYIKCPQLANKLYAPATDADRMHFLEHHLPNSDGKKLMANSPYSRIQSFLWSLHESLYSFAGLCCSTLSPGIYAELGSMMNLFLTCENLPKMKLKVTIKQFLRSFLVNYPIDCTGYTLDNINYVFTDFLPQVHSLIDERWKVIRVSNMSALSDVASELHSSTNGRVMTTFSTAAATSSSSSLSSSMTSNTSIANSIHTLSLAASATGSPLISRHGSEFFSSSSRDGTNGQEGTLLATGTGITGNISASRDVTQSELEAELIDDQSNRILSREFVDLLLACFFSTPNSQRSQLQQVQQQTGVVTNVTSICVNDEQSQGFMDMDTDMDTFDTANEGGGKVSILSDFGRKLTATYRSILVEMVTKMLLWSDSVVVSKCCMLMRHLMKELIEAKVINSIHQIQFLVEYLLNALRYSDVEADGIVSVLIGLLFTLYEAICLMEYESPECKVLQLREPFWIQSNTNASDWDKFESEYIKPVLKGDKKINEKKKKDALKNLLNHIIGANTY